MVTVIGRSVLIEPLVVRIRTSASIDAGTVSVTLPFTVAIQARNLAKLNEAGVRIAFGTDGRRNPHGEMADMVAAGVIKGVHYCYFS